MAKYDTYLLLKANGSLEFIGAYPNEERREAEVRRLVIVNPGTTYLLGTINEAVQGNVRLERGSVTFNGQISWHIDTVQVK